MKVVLLGCSRFGVQVARLAQQAGHTLAVVDKESDNFSRLGPDFQGEMVLGTGIDEDVLRRAGIEDAAAFIAATNSDNTNLMAAQVVKEVFHVPKIVARVHDAMRGEIFQELGVQTICPTLVGAQWVLDNILGKETS